ncbi:hypothetical protein [Salmonirosea aquatica]|uniref:Lipocalin-like domain-containing protein n=1 Tax=Salmonirosea aquatica TaxID=2654236 RepID=A0A7C9B7Y9_9BACT|nr:hypothetical protein [Cytophagaceae bacterium SJW1-29]
MKKHSQSITQTLKWTFLFGLLVMFSCKSDDDPGPDVSAQLSGKWWCDSNKTLADQFFGADGTFQQRFNGVTSTGKWSLSSDKKTISISDVSNNLVDSWTYGLKEVSSSKLVLNYIGDYTFAPCP